jgi:hypothetical protein
MENPITQELSIPVQELEDIANLMVTYTGNLAKVSRDPSIPYNAIALRTLLAKEPAIRRRYQELLAQTMQEAGLHIAERILAIKEMQDQAFGDEDKMIPPDPQTVLSCSKEISRLIAEGKGQDVSGKSAIVLTSKEDAAELLAEFLKS